MFKYYTATFDIDSNKSPYNRGNRPVFIFASKCFAYENVGTRRAESGIAGWRWIGSGERFDGVYTRHAVSVQFWESTRTIFAYENVGTRRAESGTFRACDNNKEMCRF